MRIPAKLPAACLCACALGLLAAAPAPAASFGLSGLAVFLEAEDGSPSTQAGSHPFAFTTTIGVQTEETEGGKVVPVEEAKDLRVSFPPGLVGNPTAVQRCSAADFLAGDGFGECPNSTVLGVALIEYGNGGGTATAEAPVFNLVPSPGEPAKLGFIVENRAPVVIDTEVNPNPPYNLISPTTDISQALFFLHARLTIWGVPAAVAHDSERGDCVGPGGKGCEAGIPEKPFLTLPTDCREPLGFRFEADSWQHPAEPYPFRQTVFAEDPVAPGTALYPTGCGKLGLASTASVAPSTADAASPSGLDVGIDVEDPGLTSPTGAADGAIEKVVLTLPKGITANPSLAEGLGVCTEADLARESASSAPGQGCPEASKIGSVEVETPLLEGQLLKGSLFIAKPYENPFGTLLALYMTIKDPELGIDVNLAGKVTPDPATGQLVTTFGEPGRELPQLPFSHLRAHLREGARAPLISPPGCGSFTATATLYPYSGVAPAQAASSFRIGSGPGGGPCPPSPTPFGPGFEAGTANNAAGRYSPFRMRLTRGDAEQDMTRFSAVLPAGVLGRIAGLARCPEAAIALAASRTGPHGAAEEIAHPSCPAASRIGSTLTGAGVGAELTYVPGSLYLAGPYGGDPLSVVAIVPALAGPFDAGTVVVREALTLNPLTAEVEVDGAHSDPIPHILKGIPLNVRDIRVSVDRPGFTLNATSCKEERTRATLWGGGTALAPGGEFPVGLSDRYQAAGCASLGFSPGLQIKLRGGTRRGAFPALKAIVTPREGDANFARAVVTLPHSEFLEQGHFGTICTRVQFAAGAGNGAGCPPASVYGKARAWSPLLAAPAEGPVYLRSSSHNLPDLVVALQGPPEAPFDFQLPARIDSVNGGIRSSFEAVPDIPVSRFVLEMRGGRKGLIVNSTNICRGAHRAIAKLKGQNGRRNDIRPAVAAQGCRQGHRQHKRSAPHRRRA